MIRQLNGFADEISCQGHIKLIQVKASTSLQPESPLLSDDDPESDEIAGISRRRLNPDEARNQFLSNKSTKHNAVKSHARSSRRPYQTSSRRQEHGYEGTDEEALSESETETFDEKLARLHREVTEVKEELARQEIKEQNDTANAQKGHGLIEELNQAIQQLQRSDDPDRGNATDRILKRCDPVSLHLQAGEPKGAPTSTRKEEQGDPPPEHVRALRDIARFDERLSSLENAIGHAGILSTANSQVERAIIPSILSLDKQISLLSSASESSLETTSKKVKTLLHETRKLEDARKAAKAAKDESIPASNRYRLSRDMGRDEDPSFTETDAEQASKINALYGTLSTIESLAPLLPPVLSRLRSLRAIHADAASASQSLSHIESGQDELAEELKSWKEGLEKLEEMRNRGEQTMRSNMGSIEEWVKELEARIK